MSRSSVNICLMNYTTDHFHNRARKFLVVGTIFDEILRMLGLFLNVGGGGGVGSRLHLGLHRPCT